MRRFAVIGLGRFGSKLAIALSMSGAEVIAIDKNREVVDLIRDQVGHAVRLDSTDEEALRAQGVHNVDVAIIGMGPGGATRTASEAVMAQNTACARAMPMRLTRSMAKLCDSQDNKWLTMNTMNTNNSKRRRSMLRVSSIIGRDASATTQA